MHRWMAASLIVCLLAATVLPTAESKSSQARPGKASHMLSLALIVAGKEVKEGLEPLPAPIAKAISDIKGFLPYTHYEMHDTVVMRGANQIPVRVDLEGPDSRYIAQLQYQLTEDPRRLNVYKFDLVRAFEPRPSRQGQSDSDQGTPRPPSSREIISTAFSVNVGESIVVGTSRLNGTGKALVVILTVMQIEK
jgi:hypothetical protein